MVGFRIGALRSACWTTFFILSAVGCGDGEGGILPRANGGGGASSDGGASTNLPTSTGGASTSTGGGTELGGGTLSAGGTPSSGGVSEVATATGGSSTATSVSQVGGAATGGKPTNTGGSSTGTGGSSTGTGGSSTGTGGSSTGTGGSSIATSIGQVGGAANSGIVGNSGSTGTSEAVGTGGTTGALACDGTPSGAEQVRTRYAQAEVLAPSSCVTEEQRRTCSNGNWSNWSGTFTATTCTVCEDHDGDHRGNGCLAGLDCDDQSVSCHSGCLQLQVDGPDQDGDGAPGSFVEAARCPGTSHAKLDCNDNDSTVSPNVLECPWDFIDQNCDGKLGPHLESIGTLDCFEFVEVHATSDFVVACDGWYDAPGKVAIRRVIDLSHPYSLTTAVPSCHFGVGGDVIVVDDLTTHELVIYRIPAAGEALVEAARYPAPGEPAMVVSDAGDRVYLSEGDVVDLSDPTNPHAIGTVPFKLSSGEEVGRRLRTAYHNAKPSTSGYTYSLHARVDDASNPSAIQPVSIAYFSSSQYAYSKPTYWAQNSDALVYGVGGDYYSGNVSTGSGGIADLGLKETITGMVYVGDMLFSASIEWSSNEHKLCSGWPRSSCSSFDSGNAALDRAGSRLLVRARNAIVALDVSTGTPTVIGSWGTLSDNENGAVAVADAKRLVTLSHDGLAVIELDTTVFRGGAPLSSLNVPVFAVAQNRAVVADDGWLQGVDVTNSDAPAVTSSKRSYYNGVAVAISPTGLVVAAKENDGGDLWTLHDASSLTQIGAGVGAHPTDGAQNRAYHAGATLVLEGSTAYSQYWEVNDKSAGMVVFSVDSSGLTPLRWFEFPNLYVPDAPNAMVARNGLITFRAYPSNYGLQTMRADTGAIVEQYPAFPSRMADDGKYTFVRDDYHAGAGLSVLSGSTLPRTLLPVQLPAGYGNLRGHFAVGSGVVVSGTYLATEPNACLAAMRIVDDGG